MILFLISDCRNTHTCTKHVKQDKTALMCTTTMCLTSLTSRLWSDLSAMSRQRWIQLLMYRCRNSVGSSTAYTQGTGERGEWVAQSNDSHYFSQRAVAHMETRRLLTVVNLLTTSIECRDMSMLSRAAKYLQNHPYSHQCCFSGPAPRLSSSFCHLTRAWEQG